MYLLDTDTLVFLLRGDQTVTQAINAHETDPKAISIITYGELLYGAEKSAKPIENKARVQRLTQMVPVIDVDIVVMETFSRLKANLELDGNRMDDFDLLIASTATVLNYALVTNNTKHFSRIGDLQIENWHR